VSQTQKTTAIAVKSSLDLCGGHKPIKQSQKVALPQVDITPNNSEKLITNYMKKVDPIVKYINSQKCSFGICKVLLTDPSKMNYHIESHCNEGFKCLECQVSFSF